MDFGEPLTSSVMTPPQPTPIPQSDKTSRSPKGVTQAGLAAAHDQTPSKTLLPVADPEGVTSGAVQPPGSRGDDVVHTQEKDADELNALNDMEDEDDARAIRKVRLQGKAQRVGRALQRVRQIRRRQQGPALGWTAGGCDPSWKAQIEVEAVATRHDL